MKKPEPINKNVVCSVCDQPWSKHGDKPTLEKCVELLKAALATAERRPFTPRQFYGNTPNSVPARGIPITPADQIGRAH